MPKPNPIDPPRSGLPENPKPELSICLRCSTREIEHHDLCLVCWVGVIAEQVGKNTERVTMLEGSRTTVTGATSSQHKDREMGYELAMLPGMDWWNKYDPDHKDSNWGRCCSVCDQAVPAGRKEFHDHKTKVSNYP